MLTSKVAAAKRYQHRRHTMAAQLDWANSTALQRRE
jgi:hypothetical protein